MNDLLTHRPERGLPAGRHEKRRIELLAAIEATSEVPRRRTATPLLAAAAVFAVVGGLAFGVPAVRDKAQPPVSGMPVSAAGAQAGAGQKPAVRTLSEAEQTAFLKDCTNAVKKATAGQQSQYWDLRAVDGFEFTNLSDPDQTKSWLITKATSGNARHSTTRAVLCGRNAAGVISDALGTASAASGALLGDPVTADSHNSGLALRTVTRVTSQKGSGPQIEAILRDGYWFTPTPGQHKLFGDQSDDRGLFGETIRAYGAGNVLLYDSTVPAAKNRCYTDPQGQRVIAVEGEVKNPTVATCARMHRWPK
jgi:hypothetical protein